MPEDRKLSHPTMHYLVVTDWLYRQPAGQKRQRGFTGLIQATAYAHSQAEQHADAEVTLLDVMAIWHPEPAEMDEKPAE